MILSINDTKALEALAIFQYLTPQQMERLKVGKTRAHIRDYTLKRLTNARPAFIEGHDFGVIAGIGRLERVYHLTDQGAATIADHLALDPDEIIYPRFGLRYQNDYFHRKAFVDFHIALRHWIDAHDDLELEFFNAYYTKSKTRRSLNQFIFKPSPYIPPHYRKTIEPDGVFRFHKGDDSFLAVVEIHRKPATQAIIKQLDEHLTAISKGQNLVSERFEHPESNHILSVHENRSSFRGTLSRIEEIPDFQAFLPYFHFNLLENLREDFTKGWVKADGNESSLMSV